MEAIIKYLLMDTPLAQILLRHFKFYIVPMMNPDGVMLGNSKCNALGKNMNRLWMKPSAENEPEVYHLKKFISSLRSISYIVDFHAQEKKKGSYALGVHQGDSPFRTR